MNPGELYGRLGQMDFLVSNMQHVAWALLAALGTLALVFASVRGALLGSLQDPIAWGLRLLVVVGCLAGYDFINEALTSASRSLTQIFLDQSEWSIYWKERAEVLQPAMDGASGAMAPDWSLDRILGMAHNGIWSIVMPFCMGLQFWAGQFIGFLAMLVLSALRVLGPLMIAGGVLGSGASLRQWFSSMLQVLIWPAVPPFCLMIVADAHFRGPIGGQNIAFEMAQALTLTVLCLATPVVTSFLVGRGGIGAAGGALIGMATAAATKLGYSALMNGGSALIKAGAVGATAAESGLEKAGAVVAQHRPGLQLPGELARAALIDGDPTYPMGQRPDDDEAASARPASAARGDPQRTGEIPLPPIPQRPAGHGRAARALLARAGEIMTRAAAAHAASLPPPIDLASHRTQVGRPAPTHGRRGTRIIAVERPASAPPGPPEKTVKARRNRPQGA